MIIITTALTSPLFASHESTCSFCMLLIHHVKNCGFAVISLSVCMCIYINIYESTIFLKLGQGIKSDLPQFGFVYHIQEKVV